MTVRIRTFLTYVKIAATSSSLSEAMRIQTKNKKLTSKHCRRLNFRFTLDFRSDLLGVHLCRNIFHFQYYLFYFVFVCFWWVIVCIQGVFREPTLSQMYESL